MNMIRLTLALAATIALAPASPGIAGGCRISLQGTKCAIVPESQRQPPEFAVGDAFPVYERSMLMNIARYGLKPVDGNWRYYRSGNDVYRVDTQDFTVLEVIRNVALR